MRGGMRASPPDKVGLASLSTAVRRAGGSVAHPGPALDDALELRAAYIEGGAGGEATSLGFECLREDVEEVMGLFAELLLTPAMPQDKLDLAKAQVLNTLAHMNDSAAAIPRRKLAQLLYGSSSVFARQPTPAQVSALQRDDLIVHLQRWERPDAAILGVAGDFDAPAMRELVERTLGGWRVAPGQPAQPPPVPNSPLPPPPPPGRVFLVDRPGMTQAAVAMGEVGVSASDPDMAALDVLGDVLNSFGGRLFDRIRSREGLAYSVSGGFDTSPVDHPGLFVAGGETAAPAEFLSLLRASLQEAAEAAPTAAEVATAQEEALNSFVFNFASTGAQLQRSVAYALLGLPQDYLFRYKAAVEAVAPQDVLAAARKRLHPCSQVVVVAADARSMRAQLERAGWDVVDMDLDGPA
ncbi:hypothetical protein WJX81_001228 [Elliptochloris bilobata]|uniref:Peptidase M16 C-terminal domain-containing protein n=1 Tax=Elliptochloris bilobata TaxID=381761 RepID=A0AAW1S7T3_9CHLO